MGKSLRVSRLLEMVTLIQSRMGWNARVLAERFGISRTQVFNDVRALRKAGVPVERSAGGYTIAPSFFLPALRLTPQEALSLLFPPELFAGAMAADEVAHSARSKVLACLPPPLRESAEQLMQRTHVMLPTSGVAPEILEALRSAVAQRRRIAMAYSGREAAQLRVLQIDPYGIAFRKHAWYVVGYSVTHKEVRKFRVSRISAIEPTPLHFTVPAGFSLDAVFAGSWYVFGGEPREIGVRFSSRVARLIRERVPHPGQQIQTFRDGAVFYRATVKNLDEVAWWLVQYGGDAVVSFPDELREKVIAIATGLLQAYGVRTVRRPRAYPAAEGLAGEAVAEPGPGDTPRAKC